MAIAISGAFVRKSFLDTPQRHNGAAALLAVTAKGRLFLHRKRHTVHAVVDGGVTAVTAKGNIDPESWVEVNLPEFLINDALVATDGGAIIRSGRGDLGNFDDDDTSGQRALPECKRIKNGWTL